MAEPALRAAGSFLGALCVGEARAPPVPSPPPPPPSTARRNEHRNKPKTEHRKRSQTGTTLTWTPEAVSRWATGASARCGRTARASTARAVLRRSGTGPGPRGRARHDGPGGTQDQDQPGPVDGSGQGGLQDQDIAPRERHPTRDGSRATRDLPSPRKTIA